jgi:hypothetical protein
MEPIAVVSSTTKITSINQQSTKADDTVLIISIVLPFISLMTLVALISVAVYYCYRR